MKELLAQAAKDQNVPLELLEQILALEQEFLDLNIGSSEALARIHELLTGRDDH